MNWGKVKLVMIAVLLLACLLLGWNIWSLADSRRYIAEEELTNLQAILEADNIYLAEEAVPRRRFEADVFVGAVVADYYQWVYNSLCGEPIYRTYTTPNGLMLITESGDRYHIRGNFGFAYHATGFLTVTLPEYGNLGTLRLDDRTKETLLASAREFLKMNMLLPAETVDRYQLALTGAKRTGDLQGYFIAITLEMDGVPLCTNEAVLLIRDGIVRAMEGNWTFLSGSRTESAPVYDQVNILISEKKNIAHDRSVGLLPRTVSIRSVEPCYCPYVDEESGAVYFVPGWKITHEDGRIRVYDGVSNQVYPLDEIVYPS